MFGLLETAGLAGWAERRTSAAPPAAPPPVLYCMRRWATGVGWLAGWFSCSPSRPFPASRIGYYLKILCKENKWHDSLYSHLFHVEVVVNTFFFCLVQFSRMQTMDGA